ncbi:MAG: RNA polymerase sigma factor [Limisphaerales bacterium]
MKTTDSHSLLAAYAKTASEEAFGELVARYMDLVYSAAVRLVGNDADLAKDATQTVFVDLARKAPHLPPDVMLGGWLHHHTVYVASTLMRGERRRQARERQALQMNALQDHTKENLARIAPILDDAIDQLGAEDRTAILLRFFEQRDFPSVADALGSNEDAARKRVSRALEKLHLLLTHRGVSLPAAALGTVLASEAVTAAPAGLALSVVGSALAGAAAGGTALTVLKIINMTTLKLTVVGAIVVGGVVAPLVIQHQSLVKQREENRALRLQAEQVAKLETENDRLSNLVARAHGAPPIGDDQLRELLKLRGEVGMLRSQTNQLEGLRNENRRLQASHAKTGPASEQQPDGPDGAQARMAIAKMNDAKLLVLGLIMHAGDHNQQAARSLDQLEPYLRDKTPKMTGTNQFELVFQGSFQDLTNPSQVSQTIVLREAQGWQSPDGGWHRTYGFADGHCEVHRAADGDFETWERQHTFSPQPAPGQ